MKKNDKIHSVAKPKGPFSRRFPVDSARDRTRTIKLEADAAELLALARFLDLPQVGALTASFEITPLSGGRFGVRGQAKARVTQTCVVSLDDFETSLSEPIEAVFAPQEAADDMEAIGRRMRVDVYFDTDNDPPDPIIDGGIDLGMLAIEFLALALDPYPRKPQATFGELNEAKEAKEASPFAVLGRLKSGDKSE